MQFLKRGAFLTGTMLAACAGRSPSPPLPPSATSPTPSASAAPAPASIASTSAAPQPIRVAEPAAAAHARPAAPRSFTRVRQGTVTSLAVGKTPRLGVLVDGVVAIHDGKAFRELPSLPRELNFRDVSLFFGRDDQPRLMGYSAHSAAAEGTTAGPVRAVYLRFKAGRWQPEPSELGPLGSPDGALYGVLGFEDPEVVCRPRAVCLVKRVSGWKSVPAHAEPVPISLSGKTAWALADDHVERLEPSGFVELAPRRVFVAPSAVWADAANDVWVAEPASASVHRLSSGTWKTFPSKVGAPRVLIGDASGAIWVAGDAGVGFWYDGRFEPIPDVAGPITAAVVSGRDLWFGGGAGLYRAQPL